MAQIEFSEEIIQALKNSSKVSALTGAGVSAESGMPTFRGEEGLWPYVETKTILLDAAPETV